MVKMFNEEYSSKKVDAQTLVCMWLKDTIDDMQDTIESFDNGSATMELLQRNMELTGIDLPKGVDPVDIKFTMKDTLNRLVAICHLLLAKVSELVAGLPFTRGWDSSNRNDWLGDFPLPEEGGYSLSLSGIAPQPGFRRGLKAYIPPPCGEHASETDMPNLTVLLFERVPYRFRCGHRKHVMFIHKLFCLGKSVYLLSIDRSFTASPKPPTFFIIASINYRDKKPG